MSQNLVRCLATLLFAYYLPSAAQLRADEQADVQAGHSFHGEAYNEGPRQAAYLMPGMGQVVFSASTENELAQRFIRQGVAQLHGFWYFEAERSFRQAAVHDPNCAIAYWGMAMANSENRKRAQSFIEEAEKHKSSASRREQLFIDALAAYYRDEESDGQKIDKKQRAQDYTLALETIVEEFPEDVEAKAFLALQLWQNARAGLPIVSHVAIDSVLQDVFDTNPMHPAHHYRIHLWDRHKPERALQSAALCGPSLPGIAHMWHMPGHIYSRLHRYQDAAWQQEASARVDHGHMMRDRVLPDQIHNFAHNNEWLIRNLLKLGRVEDALALAKNMQELPRHPKYNTLKGGSSKYGRERLMLTLTTYRLWPELIALADTEQLAPTDDPERQAERLEYLGVAHALTGQISEAAAIRGELATRLATTEGSISQLESEIAEAKAAKSDESTEELSEADAKKAAVNEQRREKERGEKLKDLRQEQKQVAKQIASILAAEFAAEGQWEAALEQWGKADLKDDLLKAEWLAANSQWDEALKLVDKEIDRKPGEVLPMATKAWLLFSERGAAAATESFELLRVLASQADLQTPLLARLVPLAQELGMDQHWSIDYQPADDVGDRPDLDTLGPFRWHPYLAPEFSVENVAGEELELNQLRGKPTLVIFYLGFGCLHCVEQLHEFSPRAEQFRNSGIEIVAISTEDRDSLKKALSTYNQPLDIPLHADPELAAFKAYRCYDDFEEQPLHGTFLIDPEGHVLWQDISFEPFMDVDFVLEESHRLLDLAGFGSRLKEPEPIKTIAAKP